MVLCNLSLASPLVAVSALDIDDSGLSSELAEITEITPTGQAVAVASIANASWTATNASTPADYDMAYQAHVLLVAASGPPARVGSTDVRVDYILPEDTGSDQSNLSSVEAVLQVSHWTWQGLDDRLVLTLALWPTYLTGEYLSESSPTGTQITSSSQETDAPREYFQLSDAAVATPAGGSPEPVSVSPLVLLSPTSASVNLTVGSGAGNFTSLIYAAYVTIPPRTTVAGLPLYDYLVVSGAAVVVSAVVAVVTRRVRRKPSDLEYSEEET